MSILDEHHNHTSRSEQDHNATDLQGDQLLQAGQIDLNIVDTSEEIRQRAWITGREAYNQIYQDAVEAHKRNPWYKKLGSFAKLTAIKIGRTGIETKHRVQAEQEMIREEDYFSSNVLRKENGRSLAQTALAAARAQNQGRTREELAARSRSATYEQQIQSMTSRTDMVKTIAENAAVSRHYSTIQNLINGYMHSASVTSIDRDTLRTNLESEINEIKSEHGHQTTRLLGADLDLLMQQVDYNRKLFSDGKVKNDVDVHVRLMEIGSVLNGNVKTSLNKLESGIEGPMVGSRIGRFITNATTLGVIAGVIDVAQKAGTGAIGGVSRTATFGLPLVGSIFAGFRARAEVKRELLENDLTRAAGMARGDEGSKRAKIESLRYQTTNYDVLLQEVQQSASQALHNPADVDAFQRSVAKVLALDQVGKTIHSELISYREIHNGIEIMTDTPLLAKNRCALTQAIAMTRAMVRATVADGNAFDQAIKQYIDEESRQINESIVKPTKHVRQQYANVEAVRKGLISLASGVVIGGLSKYAVGHAIEYLQDHPSSIQASMAGIPRFGHPYGSRDLEGTVTIPGWIARLTGRTEAVTPPNYDVVLPGQPHNLAKHLGINLPTNYQLENLQRNAVDLITDKHERIHLTFTDNVQGGHLDITSLDELQNRGLSIHENLTDIPGNPQDKLVGWVADQTRPLNTIISQHFTIDGHAFNIDVPEHYGVTVDEAHKVIHVNGFLPNGTPSPQDLHFSMQNGQLILDKNDVLAFRGQTGIGLLPEIVQGNSALSAHDVFSNPAELARQHAFEGDSMHKSWNFHNLWREWTQRTGNHEGNELRAWFVGKHGELLSKANATDTVKFGGTLNPQGVIDANVPPSFNLSLPMMHDKDLAVLVNNNPGLSYKHMLVAIGFNDGSGDHTIFVPQDELGQAKIPAFLLDTDGKPSNAVQWWAHTFVEKADGSHKILDGHDVLAGGQTLPKGVIIHSLASERWEGGGPPVGLHELPTIKFSSLEPIWKAGTEVHNQIDIAQVKIEDSPWIIPAPYSRNPLEIAPLTKVYNKEDKEPQQQSEEEPLPLDHRLPQPAEEDKEPRQLQAPEEVPALPYPVEEPGAPEIETTQHQQLQSPDDRIPQEQKPSNYLGRERQLQRPPALITPPPPEEEGFQAEKSNDSEPPTQNGLSVPDQIQSFVSDAAKPDAPKSNKISTIEPVDYINPETGDLRVVTSVENAVAAEMAKDIEFIPGSHIMDKTLSSLEKVTDSHAELNLTTEELGQYLKEVVIPLKIKNTDQSPILANVYIAEEDDTSTNIPLYKQTKVGLIYRSEGKRVSFTFKLDNESPEAIKGSMMGIGTSDNMIQYPIAMQVGKIHEIILANINEHLKKKRLPWQVNRLQLKKGGFRIDLKKNS